LARLRKKEGIVGGMVGLDMDLVRLALQVIAETCVRPSAMGEGGEGQGPAGLKQVLSLVSHRGKVPREEWAAAMGVVEALQRPRDLDGDEDALLQFPPEVLGVGGSLQGCHRALCTYAFYKLG
jgi:hypothetical protein